MTDIKNLIINIPFDGYMYYPLKNSLRLISLFYTGIVENKDEVFKNLDKLEFMLKFLFISDIELPENTYLYLIKAFTDVMINGDIFENKIEKAEKVEDVEDVKNKIQTSKLNLEGITNILNEIGRIKDNNTELLNKINTKDGVTLQYISEFNGNKLENTVANNIRSINYVSFIEHINELYGKIKPITKLPDNSKIIINIEYIPSNKRISSNINAVCCFSDQLKNVIDYIKENILKNAETSNTTVEFNLVKVTYETLFNFVKEKQYTNGIFINIDINEIPYNINILMSMYSRIINDKKPFLYKYYEYKNIYPFVRQQIISRPYIFPITFINDSKSFEDCIKNVTLKDNHKNTDTILSLYYDEPNDKKYEWIDVDCLNNIIDHNDRCKNKRNNTQNESIVFESNSCSTTPQNNLWNTYWVEKGKHLVYKCDCDDTYITEEIYKNDPDKYKGGFKQTKRGNNYDLIKYILIFLVSMTVVIIISVIVSYIVKRCESKNNIFKTNKCNLNSNF